MDALSKIKEKLQAEIAQLEHELNLELPKEIMTARAHGDLSENAEYDAARNQQGFIEGRISELEAKLGNANIVDPKLLDADGRCVFGATVELEEKGKAPTTYQIVGDDEADIKKGRISINSPIARALIGKESGDRVDAQTPGGVKHYEILDVRYE